MLWFSSYWHWIEVQYWQFPILQVLSGSVLRKGCGWLCWSRLIACSSLTVRSRLSAESSFGSFLGSCCLTFPCRQLANNVQWRSSTVENIAVASFPHQWFRHIARASVLEIFWLFRTGLLAGRFCCFGRICWTWGCSKPRVGLLLLNSWSLNIKVTVVTTDVIGTPNNEQKTSMSLPPLGLRHATLALSSFVRQRKELLAHVFFEAENILLEIDDPSLWH